MIKMSVQCCHSFHYLVFTVYVYALNSRTMYVCVYICSGVEEWHLLSTGVETIGTGIGGAVGHFLYITHRK